MRAATKTALLRAATKAALLKACEVHCFVDLDLHIKIGATLRSFVCHCADLAQWAVLTDRDGEGKAEAVGRPAVVADCEPPAQKAAGS